MLYNFLLTSTHCKNMLFELYLHKNRANYTEINQFYCIIFLKLTYVVSQTSDLWLCVVMFTCVSKENCVKKNQIEIGANRYCTILVYSHVNS